MSCDKCKELLWEYFAQELSKEDENFVAAHLEQCSSCQQEANEIQKIMESLKNLPEEELPEGYHNELMEKLAQEEKIVSLPVRKMPQYKWKQFSLVAAAALIVVAVGGMQGILGLRGNQNEVVQEMAKDNVKNFGNDVEGYTVEESEDFAEKSTEVQIENTTTPKKLEPQQEKKNSVPQAKAIQAEQKAIEESSESLQKEEIQKAEMPSPINDVQEDTEPEMIQSQPRGITFTLMDEDTALEVQQEVILTVQDKEGILDSIRNLVISLGGYEVLAVEDTIKISVPSDKTEDFLDGLKKLGETRMLEVSSEKTDSVIFEVTLEAE